MQTFVHGRFDLPFAAHLGPLSAFPLPLSARHTAVNVRGLLVAFIVRWVLPRTVSHARASCPHAAYGSAPSLRASRAVTLVDGPPRAPKWPVETETHFPKATLFCRPGAICKKKVNGNMACRDGNSFLKSNTLLSPGGNLQNRATVQARENSVAFVQRTF